MGMTMRSIVGGLIASIALSITSTSNAQEDRGLTPQQLSLIFNKYDVDAEIQNGQLTGRLGDLTFYADGFNCGAKSKCTEYLLSMAFDLSAPFPVDRINAWNRDRYAGRAYIDEEGDPFIDHAFSVSGPEDEGSVYETITLWQGVVSSFVEFIGFNDGSV